MSDAASVVDDVDPGLDASRWGPAETLVFLRRSCSQGSSVGHMEKTAVVRMPLDRWQNVTPHDLLRAIERGLEVAVVAAERAALEPRVDVAYEHRVVPAADLTLSEVGETLDDQSLAGWELVGTVSGGRGSVGLVLRRPLGAGR